MTIISEGASPDGRSGLCSAERLSELRRITETSAEYPSGEWESLRAALAGAVPELLDHIEAQRAMLVEVATAARELTTELRALRDRLTAD